SGHRNIARTLARTGSPALLQGEVSQPLMDAVHSWFYKKGCQEKKLPREPEAAKSFGIQPPPAAVQVPRGVVVACVVLLPGVISFPALLSLISRKGSSERPGAVKGAPFRRGAANP